jgi:hypothetical protein
VAGGSTLESPQDRSLLIAEPLYLFWNDGGRFRNLAPAAGADLARHYSARGLAVADFDDDGDPDIAVNVNRGEPLLLRNDTPPKNRSLKIRLKGPPSVCFGAKVEVLASDSCQFQWWGADVSFLSMHAPELIFGLGQRSHAERVQVTWADATTTVLNHLPAGLTEIRHPRANPTSRDSAS